MGWRKHDLFRLRQAVGLLDLLDAYGLRDALRTSRGELVGACPLPGHAGDRSNRQAFRVSPAKGCWRCFTHCGGGDVVELAARLQGGSYAAAARVLADIEGRSTVRRPPRPPFAPQLSPSTSFQPYVKELVLRADHTFLRGKASAR
jgi:DNA primase